MTARLVTSLMKLHPAFVCMFAVSGLSAVGLAAAQIAADMYRYHEAGKGWIEVAGACNADPEHITCWKPTGEPDPKLTELINAYFLVNSQRMEVRYKHRSLLLITRSVLDRGRGGFNSSTLQVDPGGQLNQQGSVGYGGDTEETTNFYWYYPPDDVDAVDVSLILSSNTETTKLPLKAGAEATLDGGKVRILTIERADEKSLPQNYGYPYSGGGAPTAKPGPHWWVTYSLTGEGSRPVTSLNIFPLDRLGNPINNVDAKGNPVKLDQSGRNRGYVPYNPVVMQMGDGKLLFAVNPDKVSSLQISGNTQQKVPFHNIALRPTK